MAITITLPTTSHSCDRLEMRSTTPNTAAAFTKTVNKNNNGKQFRIARSFLHKHVAGAAASTIAAGAVPIPAETALLDFHTAAAVTVTALSGVTCTPTPGLGLTAEGTPAKCGIAYGRHVITLDSMPTESVRTVKKTLRYTSPVGGCSVEETTKGTYESYECSNRGACDGKSGLCQCYEGYSGQSCQTQTVLV